METRILIKNSGAAGSTATMEFPAAKYHELTIGRDTSCDLKFDPNDDLVSRRHAKITEAAGGGGYKIADLGSRNGTFVNKQRIFEPVSLNCGDVVQLGPGGPQFEFDLDPRPAAMARPTRLAEDVSVAPGPAVMGPTREAVPAPLASAPMATRVGRATVERMIVQIKTQSRKTVYMAVGGMVLLLVLVASGLYFARPRQVNIVKNIETRVVPDGLTPTQISQGNTDATVMIEVAWKLVEMESGKQLFHVVTRNAKQVKGKDGKPVKGKDGKPKEEPIAPGGDDYLPVFMPGPQGGIQPVLATSDGNGKNYPIGGVHGGSGFVVTNDGFILTNRHVAAAWHTTYGFENEIEKVRYGVLFASQTYEAKPIPAQAFSQFGFIPAQAKLLCNLATNDVFQMDSSPVWNKKLEGRNDVMDVSFPHNRMRIPAKLARVSDRMDVAMIKIDTPATLKKAELNDNWDTIKVGEPVVVLGYPAVSEFVAPIVEVAASKDILNPAAASKIVPDTTLSAGNIARIVRGNTVIGEGEHFDGDFYQLTINSTGHGNSGGPMFDGYGKVIGIFTLGWQEPGGHVNVSGAIPIRYGMELMGIKSGVR